MSKSLKDKIETQIARAAEDVAEAQAEAKAAPVVDVRQVPKVEGAANVTYTRNGALRVDY